VATRSPGTPRRRYSVADTLDEDGARALIQRALAGGTQIERSGGERQRTVLWRDFGDETLVHLDSVVVRMIKRFVLVSVDLETEQTGRAALIVTLAFGSTQDGAGLIAATDEAPRGHPLLAARWGRVLQETVWSALLDLARAHAEERGKVPLAIHFLAGHLRFGNVQPLALGEAALRSFDLAYPGRRKADPTRATKPGSRR
jgi:hypothetical protein